MVKLVVELVRSAVLHQSRYSRGMLHPGVECCRSSKELNQSVMAYQCIRIDAYLINTQQHGCALGL